MDEPLAAGAVSLEEAPTIVGPISTPETPDAEDATPDGTIEGSGGVKFAPLAAVIAERTQRKEAQKQLKDNATELAALREKAASLDELKGYVEQARPIIEAVRARPDLVEAAQHPQKPTVELTLTPDEAAEYAKDLDLYKPDGTPDIDRAQRLAARQEAISARQAQRAVAPMLASTAQQTAHQMKQNLLAYKDAQGRTVDPRALEQMFAVVPPELSSRPEVAQVLYYAAKGMSEQTAKAPTLAPGAVVPTESVGGGKGPAPMSSVEESFARAAGVSKADFTKTSAKFVAGRTNSLE